MGPEFKIESAIFFNTKTDGLTNLRLNMEFSKEKRRHFENSASEFSTDLISFFGENPSARLAPLIPLPEQLASMNLLVDAMEDKSLRKLGSDVKYMMSRPILFDYYAASTDIANQTPSIISEFAFCWDLRRDLPIDGRLKSTFAHLSVENQAVNINVTEHPQIHFVFSPQLITTPDTARSVAPPTFESNNKVKRKIACIDNGKKVLLDEIVKQGNEVITFSHTVHLLGSFSHESKEVYVYGSNAHNTKRSQELQESKKFSLRTALNPNFT